MRELSKVDDENSKRKIFQNALSLRVILTAVAMTFAVFAAFAAPVFRENLVARSVAIAAIATFFTIGAGTLSMILQSEMKMRNLAIAQIFGKTLAVGAIYIVCKFIFTIPNSDAFFAVIYASILGAIATLILTFFFARKLIQIRFRFNSTFAKKFLRAAAPFGLAIILGTIYFKIDIVLFSFLLPAAENEFCNFKFCAETEAANYGVAVRLLEFLTVFPLFFANAFLPVLSRRVKKIDEKLRQFLQKIFKIALIFGLTMTASVAFLSREIILLIADSKFLSNFDRGIFGADLAVQILSAAAAASFLAIILNFFLIAFGAQKKILKINFIATVFNFATNLIFIPKFGFIGAAATSVGSEILVFVLAFFAFSKIVPKFYVSFFATLKIIFISFSTAFFARGTLDFFAQFFNLEISFFAAVFAGGAVFAILVFILQIFKIADLQILLRRK